MWRAVSGVVALVVVAILDLALLWAFGGPTNSPVGQALTNAFWALQPPLAAILVAARPARAEGQKFVEDAGGQSALALAILQAIAIFVLLQLASFAFGVAVLFNDKVMMGLCAQGQQDRCAQIAQDMAGAAGATTLIGGGLFVVLIAMLCFGFAGYRIGWRARRRGCLGAIATPMLVALLLIGQNLLSLFVFGDDVDASLISADPPSLALARLPLGIFGMLPALIGWAMSLPVDRTARRYAFAVARASRRGATDAASLKTDFLSVLGFSPAEYELLVRRRSNDAAAGSPPAAEKQ